eukprot:TRINITY_DN44378_c0_g1_i1.p2 TRINITY_DN44378_c0_g1~~TRINITY_DN44378_c0_g1_i1.p2  ORF type:complete len:177 (+),score=32.75 TRINITY_DN44378_c0_g1_i1:79-531(+)
MQRAVQHNSLAAVLHVVRFLEGKGQPVPRDTLKTWVRVAVASSSTTTLRGLLSLSAENSRNLHGYAMRHVACTNNHAVVDAVRQLSPEMDLGSALCVAIRTRQRGMAKRLRELGASAQVTNGCKRCERQREKEAPPRGSKRCPAMKRAAG